MRAPSETPRAGSNRRNFLQATCAAASLAPALGVASASAKGANERLGVGFIGTGGRAQAHIDIVMALRERGVAEPVAVCDVYRPRLDAAAKKTGAKAYMEHEALLADPRVDVVCVATPDRLHAPQTIDAIKAGKDVYCEKPLTHWGQFEVAKTIEDLAAQQGRLVQVGTQHMADDNYPEIIRLVREGIIGKPMHATCSYFRRGDWGERMPIPDAAARPGPDLLWDRFLGDAPKVPFSVSRFFQWRMYWDYAGGPATDLLVHTFTPVFCVLELGYPDRVFGGGGTFEYNREVPDQCNILADYPGGPSVVMTNSLSNATPADTVIRGTDGIITWGMLQGGQEYGVRIVPFGKGRRELIIPWKGQGDTSKLWVDFLSCVKRRKQPLCNIAMAVKVQAPLSMGIVSHRSSKVVKFDQASKTFACV
ncbi:Inositol 2-dehydrogenase/D-chiro-inositol 3-dehydrogenase [Aquisphaera giovannonii]|uniref:Inositol 2-dehydrogenase/D-chiro-inositol 3-dehydrogenase n=1 Tax=Aquisphaera giovannonii TaxID=406548 RepID=A0A5B9WBA6_9BACT|nr:Gfo/Idh/MocA family oxidoreductase [Aquisphaera giovannonii]QEH37958.1 Inositol 2-dehydrogenase/D-chiro-inositol 3-dehydrogenase [Aquisphaera giovannonii]